MGKQIKKLIKKIPGVMKLYQLMRAFQAPLPLILKHRKRIKEYAQKHAGKRCFIIGNGPSLVPEDLDKFKGEYTFAANCSYRIFDKQNNGGAEAYRHWSNGAYFVTKAYQAAEVYSRKNGECRIYNATRGGRLEVFKRVDLDEIVNEK